MLSASSPVRDWITFAGDASLLRRCFSFRGASGIDGTLSLAMGLSSVLGQMVLITGDLALLHDSNGWLFSQSKERCLIIVLIDNAGGGIFNQLGMEKIYKGKFESIFTMPQSVDWFSIATTHGIPFRQISCLDDLTDSIKWAVSLSKTVLLRCCTNSEKDAEIRHLIRDEVRLGF